MPGDGGYGGVGSGTRSVTQDASIDPNLVEVELYGIVYIYNPANKKQLGLENPPEVPVSTDGTVPTDGAGPQEGTAPVESPAPPADSAPPVEGTPPVQTPASPTPVTTPAADITGAGGQE
jgi:hypothetical protein